MKIKKKDPPKGFIYETTVTKRYFVPLDSQIIEYIAAAEWEKDKREGSEYGITTEEESKSSTIEYIGHYLQSGLEEGSLFTEDDQKILDHIERVKTVVLETEEETWEAMSVVGPKDDPSKIRTTIIA